MFKKWLKMLLEAFLNSLKPKPEPEPQPEPEPEQPPAPSTPIDMLDPKTVVWDERVNPSSWKVTAQITSARMTSDGVEARYVGTGDWPLRIDGGTKPTIGNWWLIAKVNGVWRGATIEWLGPGKTRVVGKKWDGHDDIHGELSNWRYTSGETVGIMISTVGRGAPYTIQERSQIFVVVVP